MPLSMWIVIVAAASVALAYLNSPGWTWLGAGAVLLLAGLGVAWLAGNAIAWGALAALAVVLGLKAGIEEAAMSRAHAGYVGYRQRTKRFVPGVW